MLGRDCRGESLELGSTRRMPVLLRMASFCGRLGVLSRVGLGPSLEDGTNLPARLKAPDWGRVLAWR